VKAVLGKALMLALVTFDLLLIALLGLYISTRHVAAISAADARR
jgi:hypothetical protein